MEYIVASDDCSPVSLVEGAPVARRGHDEDCRATADSVVQAQEQQQGPSVATTNREQRDSDKRRSDRDENKSVDHFSHPERERHSNRTDATRKGKTHVKRRFV